MVFINTNVRSINVDAVMEHVLEQVVLHFDQALAAEKVSGISTGGNGASFRRGYLHLIEVHVLTTLRNHCHSASCIDRDVLDFGVL